LKHVEASLNPLNWLFRPDKYHMAVLVVNSRASLSNSELSLTALASDASAASDESVIEYI
jgi:hypothetical protein